MKNKSISKIKKEMNKFLVSKEGKIVEKSTIALGVILFAMILFVSSVKAQEVPHPDLHAQQQPPQQAIVLATVNIYDAKIISQEKNTIGISFDINNREKVQPDFRYGVQLILLEEGGRVSPVVDQKNYTEVIDLAENETIHKTISYVAPEYLKGKYRVKIFGENSKGLDLAMNLAGEVTLEGNEQYVEIVSDSCYLTVEEDQTGYKYGLSDGVDVLKEENLRATCEVFNHFDRSLTLKPKFETHYRSLSGEIVPVSDGDQSTLSIGSREKKSFSFFIPKAQKPQAYDIALTFPDDNGQLISNQVVFHYVLRGIGATIQNLRLDKDYYQKNEVAKASFFWSASADSFYGSRLGASELKKIKLDILIKNNLGEDCNKIFTKDIDNNDNKLRPVELDIPIIRDCANPQILVDIKDEGGNVLDSANLSVSSNNIPAKENIFQYVTPAVVLSFILVVAFIVVFIVIIIKRRRAKVNIVIFFFAVIGSLFFFTGDNTAQADTLVSGNITIVVAINKYSFASEDAIQTYAYGRAITCANGPPKTVHIDAYPYPGGPGHCMMYFRCGGYESGCPHEKAFWDKLPARLSGSTYASFYVTEDRYYVYTIPYYVAPPVPTCTNAPSCAVTGQTCSSGTLTTCSDTNGDGCLEASITANSDRCNNDIACSDGVVGKHCVGSSPVNCTDTDGDRFLEATPIDSSQCKHDIKCSDGILGKHCDGSNVITCADTDEDGFLEATMSACISPVVCAGGAPNSFCCTPDNTCAAETCKGKSCIDACGVAHSGSKNCLKIIDGGWKEAAS